MDTNDSFNPVPSQGPVVGIIIVIIVLIIGAFYFFTRLSAINPMEPIDTATTSEDLVFPPVSRSDETDAIASDLEAEDFENIDAELNDLDAEFGY